jgi:hypothetical protein
VLNQLGLSRKCDPDLENRGPNHLEAAGIEPEFI